MTFSFIKYICSSSSTSQNNTTIIYTAHSTLDQLISSTFLSQEVHLPRNVNFIKLPRITRNYIIHFFVKCFLNPSIFFQSTVVFDDYPFRFASNQVLYFHQPNLIYNNSRLWSVKRFALRLLLSTPLTIYFQTNHIRQAFFTRFGFYKSISFLHSLD